MFSDDNNRIRALCLLIFFGSTAFFLVLVAPSLIENPDMIGAFSAEFVNSNAGAIPLMSFFVVRRSMFGSFMTQKPMPLDMVGFVR
ncbi:MAG: hypothetical protein ACI8Z1_000065 [Candidatus Azotimanducaceae bacterium]